MDIMNLNTIPRYVIAFASHIIHAFSKQMSSQIDFYSVHLNSVVGSYASHENGVRKAPIS